MLTEYEDLLRQLRAAQQTISSLHEQGRALEEREAELAARRAKLNDRILDGEELDQALDSLDHDERVTQSQRDALANRCVDAEQKLHALLPQAGPPFQRLRHAIYMRTLELETGLALQRVSTAKRGNAEKIALELASMSVGVEEVNGCVVPDCSSFYTSRPFEDDNSAQPRWTRAEVVAALLEVCAALCDNAEKLLARVNSGGLGDKFAVPEFFLGEPPAPAVPGFGTLRDATGRVINDATLLEWSQPLGGGERELAEKICKAANKDINNLTDRDKFILAKTLENYRVIHGRTVPQPAPEAAEPAQSELITQTNS